MPSTTLQTIPAGTPGTKRTLEIMRKLVHEGKKSPLVRHVSVLLTQDIEQKNKFAEIYALYNFVKDRIRYVRDIRNVETLHTAERILQNKAGDCDDKSILLASLLESLGFKTRFVAVGFAPPKKGFFGKPQARGYSHVLPEVLLKNAWIPLETTEPVNIGWFPHKAKSALVIYN